MHDISNFLEENYGPRISIETISNITDKVWDEIKSWRDKMGQPHTLFSVYEAHSPDYLYSQYGGRVSSIDPQGYKDKGSISQ